MRWILYVVFELLNYVREFFVLHFIDSIRFSSIIHVFDLFNLQHYSNDIFNYFFIWTSESYVQFFLELLNQIAVFLRERDRVISPDEHLAKSFPKSTKLDGLVNMHSEKKISDNLPTRW